VAVVVVVDRVPQPVAGVKAAQVLPPFFVSLETVAVSVTAEEPAGIVVEELDEVRLTATGLLPPPQAVKNRKKIKVKAERTTLYLRIRAPWHN
jgi:hypothetical protein